MLSLPKKTTNRLVRVMVNSERWGFLNGLESHRNLVSLSRAKHDRGLASFLSKARVGGRKGKPLMLDCEHIRFRRQIPDNRKA